LYIASPYSTISIINLFTDLNYVVLEKFDMLLFFLLSDNKYVNKKTVFSIMHAKSVGSTIN